MLWASFKAKPSFKYLIPAGGFWKTSRPLKIPIRAFLCTAQNVLHGILRIYGQLVKTLKSHRTLDTLLASIIWNIEVKNHFFFKCSFSVSKKDILTFFVCFI